MSRGLTICVATFEGERPAFELGEGAQLVAWYASHLWDGATLPTPLTTQRSAQIQGATMVLRSLVQWMEAQSQPVALTLCCATEEEAVLYRQTYNLWYAQTKEERL